MATPTLELPVTCVATGDATIGADCALNTTLDALMPGIAREGSGRTGSSARWSVKDAGPERHRLRRRAARATCGDGDEQTFMRQGVFVP